MYRSNSPFLHDFADNQKLEHGLLKRIRVERSAIRVELMQDDFKTMGRLMQTDFLTKCTELDAELEAGIADRHPNAGNRGEGSDETPSLGYLLSK